MDKNAIFKTTATWGLVLGIALVLFSLVPYIFGVYTLPKSLGLLQWLVIIGGIVIGQIKHRDDDLNGYISYGRAFGVGMLVMIWATIIYGVYFVCLVKVIDPQYVEKVVEAQAETLYAAGYTEEMVEMAISVSSNMSPMVMFVSAVLGNALLGLIISLISSAFVKREQPIFTPTDNEEQSL